jgi:hypothetical protein
VRAVELDAVDAIGHGGLRGDGEGLDGLPDLAVGHLVGGLALQRGQARESPERMEVVMDVRLPLYAEVEKLRDHLGAMAMKAGREDDQSGAPPGTPFLVGHVALARRTFLEVVQERPMRGGHDSVLHPDRADLDRREQLRRCVHRSSCLGGRGQTRARSSRETATGIEPIEDQSLG